MKCFRTRPNSYAFAFEYGLGFVAVWHLIEDLQHGQWKVYSGDFYPWRQLAPMHEGHYALILAVEVGALLCLFARIAPRWAALAVGVALFVDNLGSYLNHRLLMSLEFLLVSLRPAPSQPIFPSWHQTKVYWNLDLVRWQLTLVYLSAGLHKINSEFLSGQTLQNLFWMTHHHGAKVYPAWMAAVLESPSVCQFLAWSTVLIELTLAFGLNFRRTVWPSMILAVVFHLTMAAVMAYIKIFTALVFVSLIAFLPYPLLCRVGPSGRSPMRDGCV